MTTETKQYVIPRASEGFMICVARTDMKIDLCKSNGSSPPCIPTVLEQPAIREAIQRGTRKAQVWKYAWGRQKSREYTSDFVQATYLALLEHHAEKFAALPAEDQLKFVEKLATSIAWKEVYPMKREVPLAESFDGDQFDSEGPQFFACDDISLNGQGKHPSWISAHAFESELIERIDRQRAATPPEEQTETKYERMHRLLGAQKADWMLDYENSRYESPKTSAERVRYHRRRKKLDEM
jgi:hypothetical protein